MAVNIALAQMKMSQSMDENFEKSLYLIREASGRGADLICFPEIQLSPFFPQYERQDAIRYVMAQDSVYIKKMRQECLERKIFCSPNFYIEENGCRYDMSLLIDDMGEVIGRQKMVHIAQAEQFYEQDYYTPSEEGFEVFDTRLGRIGIVVCFDRHYPESIRTEALRGAQLIVVPTANTAAEPSEMFQWEMKVQAFQNSVNIVMCNRCGREGGMEFSGESMAVDYNGETLALAGSDEQLLMAGVDNDAVINVRKARPYTSLRRPEMYE